MSKTGRHWSKALLVVNLQTTQDTFQVMFPDLTKVIQNHRRNDKRLVNRLISKLSFPHGSKVYLLQLFPKFICSSCSQRFSLCKHTLTFCWQITQDAKVFLRIILPDWNNLFLSNWKKYYNKVVVILVFHRCSVALTSSFAGIFADTDSCCREHDHCKHTILSFHSQFGVFNRNIFTMSHCDCDNT